METSNEQERPPDHDDQSEMTEAEIDQTLADTFPASDPPSWTLGTDHGHESTTPPPEDGSEAE